MQGSGALGALGPRVQIRSRSELCFRRRPRALEKQRPEWVEVRAVLRTLAAYGGRRCNFWSGEAADRSMVAEGGWKTVRSIGEAFLAVFGPFRGASMH